MSARPAVLDTLNHEFELVCANLEARPWLQRRMQSGDAVCSHGAVMTCEGLQPGDEFIIRAVMRMKGYTEGWNDEAGRTKAEVEAALRSIIVTDADLEKTFGPRWVDIIAVIRRAALLTEAEVERLDTAWHATSNTARYTAGDAAGDATRGAAAWYAAAVHAAGDAAWYAAAAVAVADLVGQHGLTQEHIGTLMAPWVKVLGTNWKEAVK